jgi:hypothetical protein
MGIELIAHCIGLFNYYRAGKENNIAAGYPKTLISQVRLLCTFAMLSGLLLLCGDVESNPGPNSKRCAICGVIQKDAATISYFSYPKNPEQ